MPSIKRQIADKIVQRIQTNVPALKIVTFDRVRLLGSDFRDHELPAAQLYDVGQRNTLDKARRLVEWRIALEVVIKGLETGGVDQRDLWDLEEQLDDVLTTQPKLGIAEVIHLIYDGSITDLHLLEPHYMVRMDLMVLYHKPLDC